MKKFLDSKLGEKIILLSTSALNLLFTIIFYSVRLEESPLDIDRVDYNLWTANTLFFGSFRINYFSAYFIAAFVLGLVFYILSAAILFLQKKKWAFYISVVYNIALSVTALIVHIALSVVFAPGAIVCVILSILTSGAALAYLIISRKSEADEEVTDDENSTESPVSPKRAKVCRIIMLVCQCVLTVILALTFFVPLYSETSSGVTTSYALIKALTVNNYPIYIYIAFIVMFVAFFATLMYFVSTISAFFRSRKGFAVKSQKYMYVGAIYTLLFFIAGFCFAFYTNLSSNTEGMQATTTSYICFILALVSLIAFSVVRGVSGEEADDADLSKVKSFKLEPLIFVTLLTIVTYVSLVFNVVEIRFTISSFEAQNIALTGYQLLTTYQELESGFQVLAFMLFAVLLVSGILFVLSVVSFFTKNKDYYKVVKTSAICNVIFVALIGLFGIYFKIAQKINMENIESLLNYYGFNGVNYDYIVSSQTIYALIASVIIIVIMLIRGQFSLACDSTFELTLPQEESALPFDNVSASATSDVAKDDAASETDIPDFDACPAFTELDTKIEQFDKELAIRRENLFAGLTLPNLVRFVVDYARECRLHLSYSLEDMATFVAGLGASRLTILQGMSGTGKTSLPKIFTEAIMGTCEIVEVESSWRDKNELLGYYNEFSRCFTPKKFTQCLYKARLNSTVPTFIVLDEMNLSRIEYYFSDFLSLMEHEEDKREIKLLNVKLFQTVNGEKIPYKGLVDGHTIKIPANVWFIGTANRDESTFEISDKVYDRAQTMNFNKRAPKIHSFSEPLPQRFASYEMITNLFEEAKKTIVFEAEDNAIIQKVEKLLMPYNISFGNRILNQMESFVKIYCACFGDKNAVEKDAVEKILLSKVVSKLESKVVENKEALAAEFDKLGLPACSAFIRKLNED